MHLVSDPNNRRTTFPVRRSAHGLGTSRHYSRHSRSTRSLLYNHDTTQRQCELRTPHVVPPPHTPPLQKSRQDSVFIVPASRSRRVISPDAFSSVRTECVMLSHPSQHRRTAELRVCALWQGTTRSHQTGGLLWHFHRLINGV